MLKWLDDEIPRTAELVEQFNLFDMAIDHEDQGSSLSALAIRESTVMMRERVKAEPPRVSLRGKKNGLGPAAAPQPPAAEPVQPIAEPLIT